MKVRVDVEREIGDIRPDIKKEIKRMGVELSEKAAQIQHVLNEFDGSLQVRRTTNYDRFVSFENLSQCIKRGIINH